MSKLRLSCFSISLDGFGAGPNQSLENPLGEGGMDLQKWFFGTQTFQKLSGAAGSTGVDNDFAVRGFENVGAWIMGRNMFGPVRGEWPDKEWKGWWGENPPFHTSVFVLTHHRRAPLEMEGGTTFYFVTDGIASALKKAKEAAKGKDVRLGGGVATVREYLKAGLIDDMHLALSPCLLGSGEPLLQGIDLKKLGYRCLEHVPTEKATHLIVGR